MSESVWKPNNTPQRTEVVPFKDGGMPAHVVRWAFEPGECLWVDFAVYCVGYSDDAGMYFETPDAVSVADSTTDLDLARPLMHGFVKWDGCTQMWFEDSIHIDCRAELDDVFAAIEYARRVALVDIIGDQQDVEEYDET